MEEERPKRMALIAPQGTLDWAYPPFILASTAVAMEMQVAVFFTFYGLTLLKRKITAKRNIAPGSMVPVTEVHPITGGNAPETPPITTFWGVRRFSQTVYMIT